jgi:protein SCO1/2
MRAIYPALLIAAFAFVSCDTIDRASDSPAVPAPVAPTASGPSIYELEGNWTNQDGATVALTDLRGKTRLVAMVFTGCTYACPRIVSEMKAMERRIPAEQRDRLGFVLVTFDVDRDTPMQLMAFA